MRHVLVALALAGCTPEDSSADEMAALTTRVTALEADRTQLQTDLTAATGRITTLETQLTAANGQITALQGMTGFHTTDIAAIGLRLANVEVDVNILVGDVGDVTSDVGDLQGDVTALQTDSITIDTKWTIGSVGNYGTLGQAWAAAEQVRLMPDAHLTLELLDGDHSVVTTLTLNHADGERIFIEGSDSENVTVGPAGFEVTEGHRFGSISGITLVGPDTEQGTGLSVRQAAYVSVHDLVVTKYGLGIQALLGSTIYGYDTQVVDNVVGLSLESASVADLNALVANGNTYGVSLSGGSVLYSPQLDANANSSGVIAAVGSIVQASGIDTTGSFAGVGLFDGSMLQGEGGTFGDVPAGFSVEAHGGSYAYIGGSTFRNSGVAVIAGHNSVVDAAGASVTNVNTPSTVTTGSTVYGP